MGNQRPLDPEIKEQLARMRESAIFKNNPAPSNMLKTIIELALEGVPVTQTSIALTPAFRNRLHAEGLIRSTIANLRAVLLDYSQHEGQHDPVSIMLPVPLAKGRPRGSKKTGIGQLKLTEGSSYAPQIMYAHQRQDHAEWCIQKGTPCLNRFSKPLLSTAYSAFHEAMCYSPFNARAWYGRAKAVFLIYHSGFTDKLVDTALQERQPIKSTMHPYLREAETDALVAKGFREDTLETNLLLTEIYCAAGDPKKALEFFQTAQKLSPEGAIDSLAGLKFLRCAGQTEKSIAAAHTFAERRPFDIAAKERLAEILLLSCGELDSSKALGAAIYPLTEALFYEPNNLTLNMLFLRWYELAGNDDSAQFQKRFMKTLLGAETAAQWPHLWPDNVASFDPD